MVGKKEKKMIRNWNENEKIKDPTADMTAISSSNNPDETIWVESRLSFQGFDFFKNKDWKFISKSDDGIYSYDDPYLKKVEKKARKELQERLDKASTTKVFEGGVMFKNIVLGGNTKLPKTIIGDFDLEGCSIAFGADLPETIEGDMSLNRCTIEKNVILPKSVENFSLCNGSVSENVHLPRFLKDMSLKNSNLERGIVFPESVTRLLISNCPFDHLVLPYAIQKTLVIHTCTLSQWVAYPGEIGGDFSLQKCQIIRTTGMGREKLERGGIQGFVNAGEDDKPPKIVRGNLTISNCFFSEEAGCTEKIILPNIIVGNMEIEGSVLSKNIIFPESVGGTTKIKGCKTLVDYKK